MKAADSYLKGDILRGHDGQEYLVISDGVDKCGQLRLRPLGEPMCLTPKPGAFRRVARGASSVLKVVAETLRPRPKRGEVPF